ncbi:VOC family protein [Cohnella rhizosphaerae]|uniref:VOC family protein n=1 Tax=Cohnella rhizosphaerae TaxID=1457232 RepID=A0A9X4QTC4_9BACL|nr:VOC family protein [Cohnella rhizosphaerae]MDG0810550.1 VOC family protein [Cohnella rhizosphaerae]
MKAQLNAYIHSEDARAQAGFYADALDGKIVSVMTLGQLPGTPADMQDKVMHLALEVAGGNVLFLADANVAVPSGGRAVTLALSFSGEDEAREAFGNLADGGTVKFPFELQPWGGHHGEVVDKYGIHWQIVKQ